MRRATFNREQMAIINKAYCDLTAIASEADLRRNKLSMSDFRCLERCFDELTNYGNTRCYIRSVVDWFAQRGFLASPDTHHINYTITVQEPCV